MFRKVLVPVDFTDKNLEAVEVAVGLCTPDHGAVHLIHVVQTVPGIAIEDDRDFYERLERDAAEKISALARPLQGENIGCTATVVVGSRAGEILKAARDGIDLIVVSSHRVDPERPGEGAGTLSYQLAVAAPCPVLLVK